MTYLLLASLGGLGWSLAEYLLHRFRGHGARGTSPFKEQHLKHHARVDYFAPLSYKVAAAIAPLTGLMVVSALLLDLGRGGALTAGFGLAYVGYELCHLRLHTHGPRGPVGRFLRRHHFSHHFGDARLNHGVTSPLWDLAFGTYRATGRLEVPEERAPVWLRPSEGGPLLPQLARDYELVPRRGR